MKKNLKKKFLIANWKMSKNYRDSLSYIQTLEKHYKDDIISANDNNITISIAPSFPFLESVCKHSNNVKTAAQDCAKYDSGSFTGEVSASMIRSIGAHYVILGHSERRKYFLETDDIIAEKLMRAILNDLIPILCCGESLKMRKSGNHLDYVANQIDYTIKSLIKKLENEPSIDDFITKDSSTHDNEKQNFKTFFSSFSEQNNFKWKQHILNFFKNLIIAYEPIWAIGANKIPTTKEIEDMHGGIKKCLKNIMDALNVRTFVDKNSSKFDNKIFHNKRGNGLIMNNLSLDIGEIPVIYGGNLNSSNASSILRCNNVDGGLVGRASLNVKDFVSILRSF